MRAGIYTPDPPAPFTSPTGLRGDIQRRLNDIDARITVNRAMIRLPGLAELIASSRVMSLDDESPLGAHTARRLHCTARPDPPAASRRGLGQREDVASREEDPDETGTAAAGQAWDREQEYHDADATETSSTNDDPTESLWLTATSRIPDICLSIENLELRLQQLCRKDEGGNSQAYNELIVALGGYRAMWRALWRNPGAQVRFEEDTASAGAGDELVGVEGTDGAGDTSRAVDRLGPVDEVGEAEGAGKDLRVEAEDGLWQVEEAGEAEGPGDGLRAEAEERPEDKTAAGLGQHVNEGLDRRHSR